MVSAKQHSILKAGAAALTLGAVAFAFVPMAAAQAMGEYGAVVGNSAGAAAAAPSAQLPSLPATSVRSDSSGTATTEIEQEDDSSASADADANDASKDQSGDDWEQVSGSAAGH